MADVREGTVITIDSKTTLTQQEYVFSLLHLGTLSKCIGLLVELGIANVLSSSDGPIEVADLAKRLELHENSLRRVMSFLASFGVLAEHEGYRFTGTAISDLLRDDNKDNICDLIRHLNSQEQQMAIVDMQYAVKTGKSSFEHAHGASFYKYMNEHPDKERVFDSGVSQFTKKVYDKIVDEFDFSRFRRIVEVAGGRGGLLLRILNRWKDIHCTLFERSVVLPNIFEELKSPELRDRFTAVEGDAVEDINVDADLYIIANTLFNYDDSHVEKMLQNFAKAMSTSQKEREACRLLIIDPDIGELAPNEPATLKRGLDLLMMAGLGGRMRSEREWRQFFEVTKGGPFEVVNVIKLPPFHCAYECKLG